MKTSLPEFVQLEFVRLFVRFIVNAGLSENVYTSMLSGFADETGTDYTDLYKLVKEQLQ